MRLNCFVPVMDDVLQVHVFGPDDEVPVWAVAKITNPDVWAISGGRAHQAEIPHEVPPRRGAGSSTDAWRAHAVTQVAAAGLNIDIPDDATRNDIIAALEAAGLRTE